MIYSLAQFLILGAATFLFVGGLTPVMRKIAIKINAVDRPNLDRKTQKEPVPYLGGVAIAIGITVASFAALLYSDFSTETFGKALSVLLPAILISAMGLYDDLKGLEPWPRLVAQTIAGIAVAIYLIQNDTLGQAFSSQAINYVLTIIWIVGICNSINFFDNLDGGASGTVSVISIFLFAIAFNQGQSLVSALAVVTAGATLGFLIWNKTPAKIYMGDAGALFLGIIIAVLTIRLDPEVGPQSRALAIPLLLMAVPILDTTTVVISRLSRGISPFTGGRDHLSHRLMRKGLGREATAYVLWAMAAAFGAVAFFACCVETTLALPAIYAAGAIWLLSLVTFLRIPATDK
jgi:UDP-GlcNAc:undecaprenyl-phosphate/decaprenyl-phosphate GlcNAc-1-phosphate transferase